MDQDVKESRAKFIDRSVEIRGLLHYALPEHVLKMVQIMCCDAYGSVLWSLKSAAVESFFKSWSSCVRRVFRLPLNTFTYLVEGHLAANFTPLRNLVIGRFAGFYQRLFDSPSSEVRFMAEIARLDCGSVSSSNLEHVRDITGLDVLTSPKMEIKRILPVKLVPEEEQWRLGLLDSLLARRDRDDVSTEESVKLCAMIASLVST